MQHVFSRTSVRGAVRSFALLAACLGLPGACTGTDQAPAADMRPLADLRHSNGNPAIGQVCDDADPCPSGVRCVVLQPDDLVGVCALPCTSDTDCDTAQRGLSICTSMPPGDMGAAPNECVLYCNAKKECPSGWTCESIQSFLICRPPQGPVRHDMGPAGPDDLSTHGG